MAKREPFPPELRDRITEVAQLCILAGCDAAETIAMCKREVRAWVQREPTR